MLFCQFKLRVVKLGVKTVFREQAFVIALLDDLAVPHHKNDVRVADRRQPVRDNETGLARHQFVEGRLNLELRAGVDIGRRFVENQHRRVDQHDSGDAEQLLLPLAEVAVVNDRIQPLRHLMNKGIAMRRRRDLPDFVI